MAFNLEMLSGENMKTGFKFFKTFALSILAFTLAERLSAAPASYTFSSFGGGLPSSATQITEYSSEDFIIDDDFEIEVEENEEQTPSGTENSKKNKKTKKQTPKSEKKDKAIITASIVGAVVLSAAVIAVTVVCVTEGETCCRENASDVCQDCTVRVYDDMVTVCSSRHELPPIDALFGGSLALIPIYVP